MTDDVRAIRCRSDLDPLHRAVSDTLDHHNHAIHGITSSWAYPCEFLEGLEEHGYLVISIEELGQIQRGATRTNDTAPGELRVQVMTSWAPYAPEIVADMIGGDADDIRRQYGNTVLVRMGLSGPMELRRGGPGPDPADVEEARRIIRDSLNGEAR